MAPPDPFPKFIYKIVEAAPPDPIPEEYPLSELDKQDGFVHLSVAEQVPTTASLFFTQHTKLWILKIELDENNLRECVDWENPGCPHLYGNFGSGDVVGEKRFERGEGGWEDVLGGDGWLDSRVRGV